MSKKIITSSTNQTVKDLVRLKDRKGVWAEGSFLVEGRRELERAINCGFELQDFLYCPEFKSDQWMPETAASSETTLSKEAFNKIATRDANDGVIGVFKQKTWKLSDLSALKKGKDAFVVAVEDVEKPGNLGAILRTADAAGVDAVIP